MLPMNRIKIKSPFPLKFAPDDKETARQKIKQQIIAWELDPLCSNDDLDLGNLPQSGEHMPQVSDIPRDFQIQYINRRKSDVEMCKEAITKFDLSCIKKIAHQVKGNAAMYGYVELEAIANDLESYALLNDLPMLNQAIERFENFILTVDIN